MPYEHVKQAMKNEVNEHERKSQYPAETCHYCGPQHMDPDNISLKYMDPFTGLE